ncbi:MAG: hypothetical protein PHO01_08880 [Desulfotomaculaceae bacterium]|nr:hypothetical protein [Desulfotomaculaceae bacterium]
MHPFDYRPVEHRLHTNHTNYVIKLIKSPAAGQQSITPLVIYRILCLIGLALALS